MPLDDIVGAIADRHANLYVEDGQLKYAGPRLASDDPLRAAIAEHRAELIELFTYAPGGRCAFPGCYRLHAPGEKSRCLDHRQRLEAAPAPSSRDERARLIAAPTATAMVASTPYAETALTQFHVGDCLDVLNGLPAGSAGLVGGSPPYSLGKDYGVASDTRTYQQWLAWLGDVSRAVRHVLEDGGRYWLNIPFDTNLQFDQGGRKFSSKQPVLADVTHLLVREQRWTNHALIVWDEGNISRRTAWGSYGRPTDPWVILPSEAILVLSKGPRKREAEGRTWDLLPEEHKEWSLATWRFPGESAKRVGHPAPFPSELPHRVIKLYSFKEDLIIDPWSGAGTTSLAATRLGRKNIYIDVNRDYADLACRRLERDGQRAVQPDQLCLPDDVSSADTLL